MERLENLVDFGEIIINKNMDGMVSISFTPSEDEPTYCLCRDTVAEALEAIFVFIDDEDHSSEKYPISYFDPAFESSENDK